MHSQRSTKLDPLTILRRSFKRRRRGKIAHLPEPVREQIHLLLDDGFTYADIIARLGDAGKTLNKDNLSRWRQHEHQDWLEEQRLKHLIRHHEQLAASEPAKDLLRLQMQFGTDTLRSFVERGPAKYVSLLNALAKLAVPASPSKPALEPKFGPSAPIIPPPSVTHSNR